MNWSWEQAQAILWLRWRLTANQFIRGGQLSAILSILIAALIAVLAIGAGIGGFALGALVLGKTNPAILVLIWDTIVFVFVIIWGIGVMVEIQRSESIDLFRLLHLPINPSHIFVFNYLASHLTPSLIIFLPAMLGLCVGTAITGGPAFLLVTGVVLGVLFMLTAWTYCMRGWLASLMSNQRRRRSVIIWITIVFIGLCQLPQLVLNSPAFHNKSKAVQQMDSAARSGLSEQILVGHLLVPPGWVAYSALSVKNGNKWPALGATAAGVFIGILGVVRAYRMTLRYYQGTDSGAGRKYVARPSPLRPRPSSLLVERDLPLLAQDTAALALATFRGLLRTPELKMACVTPLVLVLAFGWTGYNRIKAIPPEPLAAFAGTAAALLAAFSFAPTMVNTFGLDRHGFRGLVLLPTPRHRILLAKNLAFFPFVFIAAVTMLALVTWILHLSAFSLLAGLLQAPAAFMLFAILCNLTSILLPYMYSPGTLQAKKPKAKVFLGAFALLFVMPLVAVPLAIPPAFQLLLSLLGWATWLPVNLVGTAVLLAGTAWLYWQVLPAQGRLLQSREMAILKEVTEQTE